MQLQALIFDVDGTIAETADLHREAWNHAFAIHGIGWHWTRAIFSRLLPLPDGIARLRAFGMGVDPSQFASLLAGGGLRRLIAAKTAAYARALRAGAAMPRPGIIRLIAEARSADVPIAAVSTGSRIEFDLLLFHAVGFDALGWFDCVRTRDDCPGQPDAAGPYSATIRAMALNPHQCLAIDDSDEGATAAATAGLRVLATPGIYTSSHRFHGANLVLSDLGRPDAPFDVIRGNAHGHQFASLTALQDWAEASVQAA